MPGADPMPHPLTASGVRRTVHEELRKVPLREPVSEKLAHARRRTEERQRWVRPRRQGSSGKGR
jgi:hypothetical protein